MQIEQNTSPDTHDNAHSKQAAQSSSSSLADQDWNLLKEGDVVCIQTYEMDHSSSWS